MAAPAQLARPLDPPPRGLGVGPRPYALPPLLTLVGSPLEPAHRLEKLRRDRLDIRSVGQLRIGHDRGWIRIEQDDPKPLLLENAARLIGGQTSAVSHRRAKVIVGVYRPGAVLVLKVDYQLGGTHQRLMVLNL